jgi:hypothetical protein
MSKAIVIGLSILRGVGLVMAAPAQTGYAGSAGLEVAWGRASLLASQEIIRQNGRRAR